MAKGWALAGTFEWNGNGRDDLAWRNRDTGQFTIWASTGDGFAANAYGDATVDAGWSIAALADFDGDGRGDILWRNVDGTITQWTSTGDGFRPNTYYDRSVSTDWTVVQATDFDGDGRADLMFRNQASGVVTIWQATAGHGFVPNVAYDASVANDWQLVGYTGLLPPI